MARIQLQIRVGRRRSYAYVTHTRLSFKLGASCSETPLTDKSRLNCLAAPDSGKIILSDRMCCSIGFPPVTARLPRDAEVNAESAFQPPGCGDRLEARAHWSRPPAAAVRFLIDGFVHDHASESRGYCLIRFFLVARSRRCVEVLLAQMRYTLRHRLPDGLHVRIGWSREEVSQYEASH